MIQIGSIDNPDRPNQLAATVETSTTTGIMHGADRVVLKAWGPVAGDDSEDDTAVLVSLTAEGARELAQYLMTAAADVKCIKALYTER